MLLELSRLQAIRDLNTRHGYAVLEPGVTQGQLYRHLQSNGVDMVFNVTGSAVETSIIGNAVERGVGYFSSRADDVWLSEVVLGTGELLELGTGSQPASRTRNLYRYGVGPDMEGLFFQSGLGIVTAASIRLTPRAPVQGALLIGIREDEQLEELVNAFADLNRDGVLSSAVHIGNQARTRISLSPGVYHQLDARHGDEADRRALAERIVATELGNRWSAVAAVSGTPRQVKETLRLTRLRLRGLGRVGLFTSRRLDLIACLLAMAPGMARKRLLINAIRPALSLAMGIPTDVALPSVGWPLRRDVETNPDHSDSGLLYSLPMIPLEGEAVREVVDLTESVFSRHGFQAYITLNAVGRGALEGVINLAFDCRSSQDTDRAHACIRAHHEELIARGFLPYRVGVYGMGHVVDSEHPYWQRLAKLKAILDPNWILARGRYAPSVRPNE
jgi:4-cresol dehydrogenase (hydroxylating)